MVDVVDQRTRSRMMAGIRSKNTKPELAIRKGLHRKGLRFRLHASMLPGCPDIVFPKYKVALFVHGCFWHGHKCKYFKVPQTRTEFWLEKIGCNKERDSVAFAALDVLGWRIGVVWECALRGQGADQISLLFENVSEWIISGSGNMEVDSNGLSFDACSTTS